jgi:hypothetical protein
LKGFDSVVLDIRARSYNPLLEVSEEICKEVYSILYDIQIKFKEIKTNIVS